MARTPGQQLVTFWIHWKVAAIAGMDGIISFEMGYSLSGEHSMEYFVTPVAGSAWTFCTRSHLGREQEPINLTTSFILCTLAACGTG